MHFKIIGEVLALAVPFAYFAYRYYANKKSPLTSLGGQSAFAKAADATEKQNAAKGKIEALNALAAAKQTEASALKAAALEGHAAIDAVHADLDEVHAILG